MELIMEMLGELLCAIGEGAQQAAYYDVITHEGGAARYVVCCPDTGQLYSVIAEHGQRIMLIRSHRLLVQPLDAIALRPITRWAVT